MSTTEGFESDETIVEIAHPPAPSLTQGAIVAGRFLVGRRLGAGAMGVVYAAEDIGGGKEAAIKVTSIRQPDAAARFRRSVEARRSCPVEAQHPAILPLLAHGVTDGGLGYLVTPRLSPEGLQARVVSGKRLGFDQVADALAPVAGALACLHRRGWVHRDFKPSNVLAQGSDHYLTDFGLAKRFGCTEGDLRGLTLKEATKPGMLCGTPVYMSNQRLCGKEATPPDDVYAFALTFVELLLGGLPPNARGRSILVLQERRSSELLLPELPCPGVLSRLVLWGLSPDRGARPSASDFEVLLS